MTMHFLAQCLATPWAMQPEAMHAFARILAHRYARGQRADVGDEGPLGSPREPKAATSRVGSPKTGVIAVVPVSGAIMQHASDFGPCDGGTSADQISAALRQANADESVSSILLAINSPGGSVYGIAELAAEVRASAKPVTAIANSLAASAAYWLGSACSEFFVTPGGEVGSIGVWMAHEDMSQAMQAEGINVTLISAGKYKTEGHPFGPLDAEAKDYLQSRTNDYYGAFTRDVAKGRGVSADDVRSGMGQGRVLGAQAARDQKMVDGVATFDQVVRHMQKSSAKPGGSAAARSRQIAMAEHA